MVLPEWQVKGVSPKSISPVSSPEAVESNENADCKGDDHAGNVANACNDDGNNGYGKNGVSTDITGP